MRYKPWAEVRFPANGHGARWYDPSLGRFAQADTIVPGGAQGWDRYAYANNDPVRYVDPSGHMQADYDNDRGCKTAKQCGLTQLGSTEGKAGGNSKAKSDPATIATPPATPIASGTSTILPQIATTPPPSPTASPHTTNTPSPYVLTISPPPPPGWVTHTPDYLPILPFEEMYGYPALPPNLPIGEGAVAILGLPEDAAIVIDSILSLFDIRDEAIRIYGEGTPPPQVIYTPTDTPSASQIQPLDVFPIPNPSPNVIGTPTPPFSVTH